MIKTKYILPTLFVLSVILVSCTKPLTISPWSVIDQASLLVYESQVFASLEESIDKLIIKRNRNNCLVALQKKAHEEFDLLVAYDITRKEFDSLSTNPAWLEKNAKLTIRQFNGYKIYEKKFERDEIQFAFSFVDGVFIISQSPVLVENAIRVNIDNKRRMKEARPELFQFAHLKSDDGNLYIQSRSLSELHSLDLRAVNSIPALTHWLFRGAYDVSTDTGHIALTGFALEDSTLNRISLRIPHEVLLTRLIPNHASSLVYLAVTTQTDIDTVKLKGEVAVASLEDKDGVIGLVRYQFNRNAAALGDPIEEYSDYLIANLDVGKIRNDFIPFFPSTDFTYCSFKDEYLLLATSVDDLKEWIDAIEAEETWGLTPSFLKFYDKGLQESGVSFFFKNPGLWSGNSFLASHYPKLFNQLGLNNIAWCSLQFSALDNHFYSSINMEMKSAKLIEDSSEQPNATRTLLLSEVPVFVAPVVNHSTGEQELLVQDTLHNVSLISSNGVALWTRPLDGKIIEPINQIDFYKNGKLQYLIVTNAQLYVIDRLGRDVAGFPKSLNEPLLFAFLVDYDKTKNYRYLVSTRAMNLYLLDKEGTNLNEWGPKKLGLLPVLSPFHIRIGGRDYFIALLPDGSVTIYNRRGETEKSFQLPKELAGTKFFIDRKSSLRTSEIHWISKDGNLIKYNLEGERISSESILRGRNSRFILCPTVDKKSYFIARIDTDKIVMFNATGQLVFERQNPGSDQWAIQIFQRSKQPYFCFYDLEQKITYFFDDKANALIKPLDSRIIPVISPDQSKASWCIYTLADKSVIINCLP